MMDGLLIPAPGRFAGDLSLFGTFATLLGFSAADAPPDYRAQVTDVLSYFDGSSRRPDGRPLEVIPAKGLTVFVLGSSPGTSAQVAGEFGLPFAARYHTTPHSVLDTVEAYRSAFRAGRRDRPYVIVSADVVVADDDDRAGRARCAVRAVGARRPLGPRRAAVRHPRASQGAGVDAEERVVVADRVDTQFVGSPATVAERLRVLARVTGADELLVTTICTEHRDRVHSYELLAKEWGLV